MHLYVWSRRVLSWQSPILLTLLLSIGGCAVGLITPEGLTVVEGPAAEGGTSGGGTGTDPVNAAPTLTTIATFSGGTEDTDFTLTYTALKSASDASDAEDTAIVFRIEACHHQHP